MTSWLLHLSSPQDPRPETTFSGRSSTPQWLACQATEKTNSRLPSAAEAVIVPPRGNVYRAPADDEGGGTGRGREPGDGVARRERHRRRAAGPRGAGERGRADARLPPRPDREHAAPRGPPVGEH